MLEYGNRFYIEGILGLYNVMGKKRLLISKLYEDRDVNILRYTELPLLEKYEFHYDSIDPKVIIFQNIGPKVISSKISEEIKFCIVDICQF